MFFSPTHNEFIIYLQIYYNLYDFLIHINYKIFIKNKYNKHVTTVSYIQHVIQDSHEIAIITIYK